MFSSDSDKVNAVIMILSEPHPDVADFLLWYLFINLVKIKSEKTCLNYNHQNSVTMFMQMQ